MTDPGGWRDVIGADDRRILETYRRDRDTTWWPARSALLVIDVVESYVGPDLPVAEAQQVSRTACGELAWRAVPQIRLLIERFRAAGLPIVYTVVSSEQARVGAATRGEARPASGLAGDRVIDELAPGPDELVIAKNKASAFFGTSLVSYLIRQQVGRLVFTGGSTSGCVRASAVDATSLGFDVRMVEDATFDRIEQIHHTALLDIDTKYGQVVDTAEVLRAITV